MCVYLTLSLSTSVSSNMDIGDPVQLKLMESVVWCDITSSNSISLVICFLCILVNCIHVTWHAMLEKNNDNKIIKRDSFKYSLRPGTSKQLILISK